MPELISWMVSIRARSGPQIMRNGDLPVDAYEKISVTLEHDDEAEVTVAPGKWAGVTGLFVDASTFDEKLTLKLKDGKTIKLDGPLILIGAGAVSVLGDQDAVITLKNATDDTLTVSLLVARDPT